MARPILEGEHMAWFPEKSSTLYQRLTAEKKRIEIQLNRLDLARSEAEKPRQLSADKHVKEWLSSSLRSPD
jgi:hypothetical protein